MWTRDLWRAGSSPPQPARPPACAARPAVSPPPPGGTVPLLLATARPLLPATARPARAPSWHARAGRGCRGAQPPLTVGIEEIVDWAWFSAACGDAVPVIAAWMAVQMAWDTFG